MKATSLLAETLMATLLAVPMFSSVSGKMTDSRILMDTLGLMQQLGVVPNGQAPDQSV